MTESKGGYAEAYLDEIMEISELGRSKSSAEA